MNKKKIKWVVILASLILIFFNFSFFYDFPPIFSSASKKNKSSSEISLLLYPVASPYISSAGPWHERRDTIVNILRDKDYDLISLIKIINPDFDNDSNSLKYISERLPKHDYYYMRHDPDSYRSEGIALFYKKDRWELDQIERGYFWPSTQERVVIWGLFHEISSKDKRSVYLFSTHLLPEKKDEKIRENCIEEILNFIALRKNNNIPVIFMGDLNSSEKSSVVQYAKGETVLFKTGEQKLAPVNFSDALREIHPTADSVASMNNYVEFKPGDDYRCDYILLSSGLKTKFFEIIRTRTPKNRFPSYHYPHHAILDFENSLPPPPNMVTASSQTIPNSSSYLKIFELETQQLNQKNLFMQIEANYSFQQTKRLIYIFINDHPVSTWELCAKKRFKMQIPVSVFEDSSNKLKVTLFEKINKFQNTTPDTFFSDIKIQKLFIGNVTLPSISALSINIGEGIKFTQAYNPEKFLRTGWSGQEATHRWTEGHEASMRIHVPNVQKNDLLLHFDANAYLGGQIKRQLIDVSVNNHFVTTWEMTGRKWYEAEIPAHILKDNLLEISFKISNPASPCKLSESKDCRELGIAARELILLER
ncbi:hypothetical protein LJC24_00685 [Desulfococcaceae bacterium OttesenSCG-928-F15]|nr:hypothetical protein [Desulfococcaceae bacterium OttesenSCG-928-F15]